MLTHALLLVCLVGLGAALPPKPVLRKLDDLRYQHARDSAGNYHLVDMWMTVDDIRDVAQFEPLTSNVYHLFTKDNPTTSQPLLFNNAALLEHSNFSNSRRTIVLIHGWGDGGIASPFVSVLVPAFLAAEDVNVIVVDWREGSGGLISSILANAVNSGRAIGAFINWLIQQTFSSPVQFHIVGHGMGAHQAGIAGRTVGNIAYVTGLDPSLIGWVNNPDRFQATDGLYTEVIHTNSGILGYISELAQVDFYPNGGESMPGCDTPACDHERAIHYFAESIVSGGFTGRQCVNYLAAVLQQCNVLPISLQMGGLRPKIGSTGAFLVETNAAPPFSQD